MAQFDVHTLRGSPFDDVPFVVLAQSGLFDGYRRRVVVPLMRSASLRANPSIRPSRLNPAFTINGIDVVLHPLDMVSINISDLGDKVSSLADQGQAITDALDELFSRAWG